MMMTILIPGIWAIKRNRIKRQKNLQRNQKNQRKLTLLIKKLKLLLMTQMIQIQDWTLTGKIQHRRINNRILLKAKRKLTQRRRRRQTMDSLPQTTLETILTTKTTCLSKMTMPSKIKTSLKTQGPKKLRKKIRVNRAGKNPSRKRMTRNSSRKQRSNSMKSIKTIKTFSKLWAVKCSPFQYQTSIKQLWPM